jgi:predicted PurR-regulated permease PerM
LLLLSLQTVLDQRGIAVDLHDRFSQVLKAVNDQVSSLLNNALGIGLQAGNVLIEVVLIFIISIYFVRDGGRLVRWLVHLAPPDSRLQAAHAVTSLDQILGSYLRTQVVLGLLAGISDALGAVILGIPYAVVIFFSSFLLSLVPVIGPVILPIPPFIIALIFTPLPKPLLYLVWLLVGEQIITNVVGPRLQGHNLRIHPLEAMAAALVGLPLAGLAGAFFAVPVVAFCHIAIREFVYARRHAAPAGGAAGARPPPGPSTEPAADGQKFTRPGG